MNYTNAATHHQRRVPRYRRPRRACSRATTPTQRTLRQRHLAVRPHPGRSRDQRAGRYRAGRAAQPQQPDVGFDAGHGRPTRRRTSTRWSKRWCRRREQRDPTLQDPNCAFQILEAPLRALHPRVRRAGVRLPEGEVPRGGPDAGRQLGPERTGSMAYAVAWTQHTIGVQIIRAAGHPAAAAGQHRAARRRHPGPARPRQHPGQHRQPDAVPLDHRLHGASEHPEAPRNPEGVSGHRDGADRRTTPTTPKFMVSYLKAMYGDESHPRQRLSATPGTRVSPATIAHSDDGRHGRRQGQGHVRHRPEPGRRRPERRAAATGAGQSGLDGRARLLRNRDGLVLVRLARGQERPAHARPTSRPRCSSCPPPTPPKAKAASPTPTGCLQWHEKAAGPARRRAHRPVVHLSAGQAAQGAVRGQHAAARSGLPQPDLELRPEPDRDARVAHQGRAQRAARSSRRSTATTSPPATT